MASASTTPVFESESNSQALVDFLNTKLKVQAKRRRHGTQPRPRLLRQPPTQWLHPARPLAAAPPAAA